MKRSQILLTTCFVIALSAVTVRGSDQIPGAEPTGVIALTGATLYTVEGPPVRNGTILIENGKITALGAGVPIPAGAERIELSGMNIYPGLIDMSTSIGLTEIGAVRATNDSRETGRINPNVKAQVAINPDSEIIPVTRSNGVTTVLVVPEGGVLSGTSALVNLDGWTWEDMTVHAPAAMHLSWPRMRTVTAWWMRDSEEEQREQRERSLAAIRDAFADARAYLKSKTSGDPRHMFDSRWEAMIPVLEKQIPVIVDADDIQQIQAAVAFGERENVRVIISGGYDAPSCADLLHKHNIPVIVTGIHRMPQRRHEPYDAPFSLPRRMREAELMFCISGGGASNVRNLPYHVGTAIAHGLPQEAALRTVTLDPAKMLGVDDRLGSLAVGKDATLIVADGDIFETPTQVVMEFINGRRVDLTDKQKMLWEKYKVKYSRQGIDN